PAGGDLPVGGNGEGPSTRGTPGGPPGLRTWPPRTARHDDLRRRAAEVHKRPFAPRRMAACGAEEAQLRLPPSGDYPDGNADDLAGLPGEHAPVRGTAHGFGGAGDELVVTVFSGPGQDLAQGSQRTRAASADRTGTRDLRAQLRHLDVMRHVLELATDHVGDQDVDGVGADVQRGKTHSPGTLESGRREEDG